MALGPLEVNISQVSYGTLPVADRRLQMKGSDTGSISVSADSTYDIVDVSGSGRVLALIHRSEGIAPDDAFLYIRSDDYLVRDYLYLDISLCNYFSLTTTYSVNSIGRYNINIATWDTTNNKYQVNVQYIEIPFANSLYAYLKNADTANSATMRGAIQYALYTSSKNIYLKPSQWWGQHIREFRRLIKQDYKECEAVIMDRYIINPDDPEDQQISAPRLQIIVPDWVDEKKIIERMIKEGIAEDVL